MTLDELKKSIGNKNVVVGTDRTLHALKLGKAVKVFLTKNCKDEIKEEVNKLASLGKVPVEELDISNEELGTLYKRPFLISVLSFVKE